MRARSDAARRTAGPRVSISSDNVAVSGMTAAPADVWLIRFEPRDIDVAIKADEHGGKAHFALPAAARPGLATAAFLQTGPGGPITAAVRGPITAAVRGKITAAVRS